MINIATVGAHVSAMAATKATAKLRKKHQVTKATAKRREIHQVTRRIQT